MMEKVIAVESNSQNSVVPTVPRELGGWVMLGAPLLIGLAAAWPTPAIPAVLLLVAIGSSYLAHHVSVVVPRKNLPRDPIRSHWFRTYVVLTAASSLPLLIIYDRLALLALAGLAAVIYLLHLVMKRLPIGTPVLTQWSELVKMIALTLTAPAAYVTAGGQLDGMALCLWSGCALFFGSSVFHLRMLSSAATEKAPLRNADRWRLGRSNLVYHALLMIAVYYSASHLPLWSATLLWIGYLPVVVRALDGTIVLSNHALSSKRVAWSETSYALWFALCFIGALHG